MGCRAAKATLQMNYSATVVLASVVFVSVAAVSANASVATKSATKTITFFIFFSFYKIWNYTLFLSQMYQIFVIFFNNMNFSLLVHYLFKKSPKWLRFLSKKVAQS